MPIGTGRRATAAGSASRSRSAGRAVQAPSAQAPSTSGRSRQSTIGASCGLLPARLSLAGALSGRIEGATSQMPHVKLRDGAELYYEKHGNGPPLFLVPGLGGDGRWWGDNVAKLAEQFTVVVHDHRGTGRSTLSRIAYSVAQMADDALQLIDGAGLRQGPLVRPFHRRRDGPGAGDRASGADRPAGAERDLGQDRRLLPPPVRGAGAGAEGAGAGGLPEGERAGAQFAVLGPRPRCRACGDGGQGERDHPGARRSCCRASPRSWRTTGATSCRRCAHATLAICRPRRHGDAALFHRGTGTLDPRRAGLCAAGRRALLSERAWRRISACNDAFLLES